MIDIFLPNQFSTEHEEMTVLVPSDAAFSEVLSDADLDRLLMDMAFVRQVVTNHIILQDGRLPQIILDRLDDGLELKKVSISDEIVIFTRKDANHSKYMF